MLTYKRGTRFKLFLLLQFNFIIILFYQERGALVDAEVDGGGVSTLYRSLNNYSIYMNGGDKAEEGGQMER